jgi:hypothetical protein
MGLRGVSVNGTEHRFDYRYLDNRPFKVDTVTLSASSWQEDGTGVYGQEVAVDGVTANGKVDLQPGASVLSQMASDGVRALWVENDGGTLTAYALGACPSASMAVQCVVTEL